MKTHMSIFILLLFKTALGFDVLVVCHFMSKILGDKQVTVVDEESVLSPK